MVSRDKELADALGIDLAKCIDKEIDDGHYDFVGVPTYYLFRHNKSKGTYYCSREECLRAMLRQGGKKMQGFGNYKWELLELFKYEKGQLRHLQMIEMQKKRYSRYKFK